MEHLRFTKTHEWLREENDQSVAIGITEHAQQLLGDMVYVELPEIGTKVTTGQELGVVESVKAAADFYAPVSGEVVAINEALQNNPALVNHDPYGNGWLVKLQPSDREECRQLLSKEQYEKDIQE